MSVLVSKRKESKLEVIVYSYEIHRMLLEFMQRNFGIKNFKLMVRRRYIAGKDEFEDYYKYRYLLTESKNRINYLASLLTANLVGANVRYPVSMKEYEKRRECQNDALVNCEQLIQELQHIVDVFDVDINQYERYVTAIDREIGLIKSWRQRDNKIKARLQG